MKVMAFGCTASDVDTYCGSFLASLSREGHKVSVVVARQQKDPSSESSAQMHSEGKRKYLEELYSVLERGIVEEAAKALFSRYGLQELFLVSDFDYSAITQKNADTLSTFRNKIEPDLVIIPFWKSADPRRRILARTALVACRGTGSVLMYGDEGAGSSFKPDVWFNESPNAELPSSTKELSSAQDLPELAPSGHQMTRNSDAFESHRLLLLEHEEIDWL